MILPPFPFPNRWNEIRQQQEAGCGAALQWSVPSASFFLQQPQYQHQYHNHHHQWNQEAQSEIYQPPTDEDATDFMPITFSQEEMKQAFAEDNEEYDVDFRLEVNEAWVQKLLPTAQRLHMIATPKKPSKAKKAHKKKMRAKCKSKKVANVDNSGGAAESAALPISAVESEEDESQDDD